MYVAEMLTDTKLHARKWNLAELYDPSIPYDATKIRFVFPLSPAPLSYGYKLNMDSHYLNDLQDLQNDLRQLFSNGAIITVFDPTLPADVQLKAYKKTHRAVRRVVDDYKLPYEHWASMIRVLDAWDCQNSNMTEIARKIGISTKGELTKKAHDLKSQTLEMVDSGYRRILFNLMKAESA